jgi:hypothetical protein
LEIHRPKLKEKAPVDQRIGIPPLEELPPNNKSSMNLPETIFSPLNQNLNSASLPTSLLPPTIILATVTPILNSPSPLLIVDL